MSRLQDKVCIVTGAARGIGRTAAHLMAAEGASVIVADVEASEARQVADDIRTGGGEATPVEMDALRDESIAAMVETARATYGRIDVLYNNVGFTDSAKDTNVLDMDWSYWNTAIQLSLGSTVFATRCALPTMLENGGDSIINTASMAALQGMMAPTMYPCAKAGVIAFTRSVATQYGPRGIRCNVIAPGLVMTSRAPNWPPAMLNAFRRHTPVGDPGQPEDIGHLAVFLASNESRYVTGQLFRVDGGVSSQNPVTPDLVDLAG